MMIKSIIVLAFLLIIFSLGSALFHLMRPKSPEHSEKTVKALTFRIGLSLVLFILIFAAVATGLIQPTGIGARMNQQTMPANSPH